MHPPQPPPPLPHEAMEAGEEPPHGDDEHVNAPTFERYEDRNVLIDEVRRSFALQGRSFKTTSSCSTHIYYKCNGCSLKFAFNLCQKKGEMFNTWGLTRKATKQSWKVCPFCLRLLVRLASSSRNHRRLLHHIARRVMHANAGSC